MVITIVIIAGVLFALNGLRLIYASKDFKENLWEAAVGTITNTSVNSKNNGNVTEFFPLISYEYTIDGQKYYTSIPIFKLKYYHHELLQEHINESYKIGENIDILYNKSRKDLSRIKQDYEFTGVNVESTVKKNGIRHLSIGIILIAAYFARSFLFTIIEPQLEKWQNYWLIITGSILALIGATVLVYVKFFNTKDKWEEFVGIIRDTHISIVKSKDSDGDYSLKFYPKISCEYVLDGIKYYSWYQHGSKSSEEAAQKVLQGYKIGETIDISYRKDKPAIAQVKKDLNKENSNSSLMGTVLLFLGIIAITGHFVWPLLWNR